MDALDLLRRAAGKLQDYCTDANGDLNDSLADEIEGFLKEQEALNDMRTPFSGANTVHVGVLDALVRRAVAGNLDEPWVACPIGVALKHCNIHSEDALHKITLISLRDRGVEYLVLPPKATGELLRRIDAEQKSLL